MRLRITLISLSLLTALSSIAATNRALIIGLGKQKDMRWGKIHGDRDVPYMEQMLKACGYTDIQKLTNESATKAAIVAALKNLAARSKRGDAVFIHYSGHGQLMTDLDGDEALRHDARHAQWDESWIPYDAYMTYCKEDRGEKHLCDDELARLLAAIRDKIGDKGRLTVSIDACHSGDATCGQEEECVRGVDVKFNIPREDSKNKSNKTQVEERWQTISACKPYQLSMEMKNLNIGKLTFILHSLGKQIFEMENKELEVLLNKHIELHKGRLPQNPTVTGKRQWR